uniref:Uncharacterized protein n=1 Tax=viral metagenome TaxID=1070528 RepID=A0A6C0ED42_9ZZZZ
MNKSIHSISTCTVNKIQLNDWIDEGESIVMDLSYETPTEPVMLYFDLFNVYSYSDKTNELKLDVTESQDVTKFFDELDRHLVSLVNKNKKLLSQYDVKTYKPLLQIGETDNGKKQLLKLKTEWKSDYKTCVYGYDKKENYNGKLLEDNCKVKTVVELLSLVLNKNTGTIHIENQVRQLQLVKLVIRPERIKHLEYSFSELTTEQPKEPQSEKKTETKKEPKKTKKTEQKRETKKQTKRGIEKYLSSDSESSSAVEEPEPSSDHTEEYGNNDSDVDLEEDD